MSTLSLEPDIVCTRAEALKQLGLSSRTTLSHYCNVLRFPPGLPGFTESEFNQLKGLRQWRLRGGRINDFFLQTNIHKKTELEIKQIAVAG